MNLFRYARTTEGYNFNEKFSYFSVTTYLTKGHNVGEIIRGLLFRATIVSCLLCFVAGCATIQRSHSGYLFENITSTCVYKTLEEMDVITKAWLSYDYLPPFPIISRSHLVGEDGIEFEGEGFFGFISIQDQGPPPRNYYVLVNIYSDDGFFYRNFALWGPEERLLRIEQIKEDIKESLLDSCNE